MINNLECKALLIWWWATPVEFCECREYRDEKSKLTDSHRKWNKQNIR